MPVLVIHLAFPLFSYVPQDGSRVIPQDIPEIESLLSDFQLLVARSISDVVLAVPIFNTIIGGTAVEWKPKDVPKTAENPINPEPTGG